MRVGSGSAPATAPSAAPAATLRRLRAAVTAIDRRVALETLMVTGAFTLLAIVVTWPVAANFTSEITSEGIGWDPAGYTWDLWFSAEHGLRLWGTSSREVLSAPFGAPLAASTNATLLVSLGPGWIVAHIAGPVAAYNVIVMSGLVLSSACAYLLVRWLGLGMGPAAVAGVALMFAPYQLAKATLHIPFVHLECFPLLILATVRWGVRPGWRRAWWVVAAVAYGWLTNPYYGLMCTVMAAIAVAVVALRLLARDGVRAATVPLGQVTGLGVLLVALPLALLFVSGRDAIESSFTNPREALSVYGARLKDYVIPDAGNLLMRGVVGVDDWGPMAAPGGERTLFVGWVTLALAVLGAVYAIAKWSTLSDRLRLAAAVLLACIPVLVWFSLASPTRWLGVDIPVPSEAIYDAAPFYRVYARFGVAVLVCVTVLAAIGVWVVGRRRGPGVRAAVAVAAGALIVVSTTPHIPVSTAYPVTIAGGDPRDAASWTWLRDEDPERGIVFEYPTGPNAYGAPFELVERYWQYGQTIHERPVLNGGLQPGAIGYDFAATVADPRWPGTAARLAGAGVSTVVINPWAYGVLGQAPIADVTAPPPGFALAETFPDGTAAWHVTAAPDPAAAVFRTGWSAPEEAGGRLWRVVQPAGGVISLIGWEPGRYEVEFLAGTSQPAPRRGVQVIGPDGVLARTRLATSPQPVTFTLDLGREPTRIRVVPLGGRGPAPVVVSAPAFEAAG